MATLALVQFWPPDGALHWLRIWPTDGTTCIDSKVGHQVTSHALPHCLGLPYWHYQLVLSLYLHQLESHLLRVKKVSHVT